MEEIRMLENALICLALNIYHEARDQPVLGMQAVAEVVLNRVEDKRFPDTVCEVVTQGPTYRWKQDFPVRHRCQFSWYCDGKSDRPKNGTAWAVSRTVAENVLRTGPIGIAGYATHYHNIHVRPNWSSTKVLIGKIGDHVFYRWAIDNALDNTKVTPYINK